MPKTERKTGSKKGRKRKRTDWQPNGKPFHRPTSYRPEIHEYYAYITALTEGTQQDLADRSGVTVTQIHRWFEKYPKFREQWDKGKFELKDASHLSLSKRVKGFIAEDVQEVYDADGNMIGKRKTKKEIIPDTQAIALVLNRCDKEKNVSYEKIDALFAILMKVVPSDVLNLKKDDPIDESPVLQDTEEKDENQ